MSTPKSQQMKSIKMTGIYPRDTLYPKHIKKKPQDGRRGALIIQSKLITSQVGNAQTGD